MYVLVTYDVSTATEGGSRRLRKVAKVCENFGQRVQNSVFECKVDPAQWVMLRGQLESIIDPAHDSLRYYHLGTHWERRVEHVGAKQGFNVDGALIV
jgi:CRISPR-associated protein Cas2